MTGVAFENQMVIWLKSQGYEAVAKTEYFDMGIDILASKEGIRYGIQVKRSKQPVGVAAIRAAVTGLNSYQCDRAMVITNSTFTYKALKLAKDNDCALINGTDLIAKLF